MTTTRSHPLRAVGIAGAILLSVAALCADDGHAAGKAQTLRFYSRTTAVVVTRADGSVISTPPYPKLANGDVLDIYALDYPGTQRKHAPTWTASQHLRCELTSPHGAPNCESDVAMQGSSLLIFRGTPGTIVAGTGHYAHATGHVLTDKDVPGGSDVVARVTLGS